MKHRQLRLLGYALVLVPYWEWEDLSQREEEDLEALRANNRPAVPPNNHITQQRLAQLGFVHPAGGMMGGGMMAGGMMGGAMAAQRGSGVFHAVRAIFLARSAFDRSSLLAVSLTRRSQPFSSTTTSRSSALRARFLTGPSDPTR